MWNQYDLWLWGYVIHFLETPSLFIVFSQICPKFKTFKVIFEKTGKDIVLKSSGIPPDEIFSAMRVFGIVKNVHKCPVGLETTEKLQKKESYSKYTPNVCQWMAHFVVHGKLLTATSKGCEVFAQIKCLLALSMCASENVKSYHDCNWALSTETVTLFFLTAYSSPELMNSGHSDSWS